MPTNNMQIFLALLSAASKSTAFADFSFTVMFDTEADLRHAFHVYLGEAPKYRGNLHFKTVGLKVTVYNRS